jgi:hypothetical protein
MSVGHARVGVDMDSLKDDEYDFNHNHMQNLLDMQDSNSLTLGPRGI